MFLPAKGALRPLCHEIRLAPPHRHLRIAVYIRAAELPPQIADDPKLRIEKVDSAPPDMEIIELLKPEHVQEPERRTRERGPALSVWSPSSVHT